MTTFLPGRVLAIAVATVLLTGCHRAPSVEVPPPRVHVPVPAPAHVDEAGGQAARRAAINAEARRIAAARSRQTITVACKFYDTYSNLTEQDVEGLIYQAGGYAGVQATMVYALLADLEDADSSGDAIRTAAVTTLCTGAEMGG